MSQYKLPKTYKRIMTALVRNWKPYLSNQQVEEGKQKSFPTSYVCVSDHFVC